MIVCYFDAHRKFPVNLDYNRIGRDVERFCNVYGPLALRFLDAGNPALYEPIKREEATPRVFLDGAREYRWWTG